MFASLVHLIRMLSKWRNSTGSRKHFVSCFTNLTRTDGHFVDIFMTYKCILVVMNRVALWISMCKIRHASHSRNIHINNKQSTISMEKCSCLHGSTKLHSDINVTRTHPCGEHTLLTLCRTPSGQTCKHNSPLQLSVWKKIFMTFVFNLKLP